MGRKTVGIIGGMGPLATADLFQKIITNTKASSDCEHLRVLIDNNTNIPDRTEAILNQGEDPTPQLICSARLLQEMGAQLLLIPCNTAHYFYESVQQAVNIPVLHMIRLTAETLHRQGITCAGLLATDGTVAGGLYQTCCEEYGIRLLYPDTEGQKTVMDLIYNGVKAGKTGYDASGIQRVVQSLLQSGAQTVILGCTELPAVASAYHLKFPFIDPTVELARSAIRAANGTCIEESSVA